MSHITWKALSLANLPTSNPAPQFRFGQDSSAMPKFLAVLRGPARMLGNAMLPMVLKGFRMHRAKLKPQTNQLKHLSNVFNPVHGISGA